MVWLIWAGTACRAPTFNTEGASRARRSPHTHPLRWGHRPREVVDRQVSYRMVYLETQKYIITVDLRPLVEATHPARGGFALRRLYLDTSVSPGRARHAVPLP